MIWELCGINEDKFKNFYFKLKLDEIALGLFNNIWDELDYKTKTWESIRAELLYLFVKSYNRKKEKCTWEIKYKAAW